MNTNAVESTLRDPRTNILIWSGTGEVSTREYVPQDILTARDELAAATAVLAKKLVAKMQTEGALQTEPSVGTTGGRSGRTR